MSFIAALFIITQIGHNPHVLQEVSKLAYPYRSLFTHMIELKTHRHISPSKTGATG
jgi:hypothetical protein